MKLIPSNIVVLNQGLELLRKSLGCQFLPRKFLIESNMYIVLLSIVIRTRQLCHISMKGAFSVSQIFHRLVLLSVLCFTVQ